MKRFAVIPNLYKDPDLKITNDIARMLEKNGINADVLTVCEDDSLKGYDCAVVLGGDGTILDVAKKAALCSVPVAGVNLGRIGYLSSVEPENTEKLLSIDENSGIQRRMMLSLFYRGKEYHALNDIVISEKRATRMISVSVSADDGDPCEYNSTSLIFSTPTGSSGYNVSAGGPVIEPTLECIAVTPVCPHTGTSRSFVYKPGTVFTAADISSADKDVLISVDGGAELPLKHGESVKITRSDIYVKLLEFDDEPFAKTLIRKMKI